MVAAVQGPKMVAKIDDVRQLRLNSEWESKVGKVMYDNRMEYDLRVEHAKDYQDLRRKLKARGVANVPVTFNFLLSDMSSYKSPQTVNAKNISKTKVMTQRGNKNN